MSVRRRKWITAKGEQKESWIVDYVDGQGDRHIETFSRKKDADDYHATVKVDVRKGLHTAPSKSVTVKQAASDWINRVEADGLERATVEMYEQHARLHIVPRLGRHNLANLTAKAIEDFRDGLLKDKQMSRPMARKVLSSFKSLLRVAKFSHLAADVGIKRNKRAEPKLAVGTDIPTPNEIKRLIDAATPGQQRAMLLVAVFCGLRASELRGLRWRDVNLKAETLRVTQRADRYAAIGPPKSEAGRREIPLDPITVAELKEWFLRCPKTEADLVFPTQHGKVQYHTNLLRGVETLQRRAKVIDKEGKAKYGLHSFRHFFASWCLNREEDGGRELPPKEVQSLLGHSSIVMTMDVYGHLFPRKNDKNAKAELAKATRALLA